MYDNCGKNPTLGVEVVKLHGAQGHGEREVIHRACTVLGSVTEKPTIELGLGY